MNSTAQVIWQQITKMTKFTVNAKDAVADDNTLMFQVTLCKARGFHKIIIELNGDDTYTVKLVKIQMPTLKREYSVKTIAEKTNIYVGQLNTTIMNMVV